MPHPFSQGTNLRGLKSHSVIWLAKLSSFSTAVQPEAEFSHAIVKRESKLRRIREAEVKSFGANG